MLIMIYLSVASAFFFIKRPRDQGPPIKHLYLIYQALFVSRLLYALLTWGYLSAELIGRIDASLERVSA
jgi:hypothetical protein